MHSVENLTVLYRGRGYWHTPELNQAIAKIINHFGDRASIPPEFIAEFMNGSEVIGGVSTVAAIAGTGIANNANAMISFFMV